MAKRIRTLEDLDFSSNTQPVVLLRLDLNVPIKKGKISDETRIKAALPTIKWLLEKNAKITIPKRPRFFISHNSDKIHTKTKINMRL